jgi:ribosomal protein S27E
VTSGKPALNTRWIMAERKGPMRACCPKCGDTYVVSENTPARCFACGTPLVIVRPPKRKKKRK